MNLFDAVPVIVNDMFSNYAPEQSISTGEKAMAVKNSILATDSLDYGNMKRSTYSHVHTMVSNAIDLIINDKDTFFNVLYPDNLTPEQKLSQLSKYLKVMAAISKKTHSLSIQYLLRIYQKEDLFPV